MVTSAEKRCRFALFFVCFGPNSEHHAESNEALAKGLSTMLATLIKYFDSKSQNTLASQDHLNSSVDDLTKGNFKEFKEESHANEIWNELNAMDFLARIDTAAELVLICSYYFDFCSLGCYLFY